MNPALPTAGAARANSPFALIAAALCALVWSLFTLPAQAALPGASTPYNAATPPPELTTAEWEQIHDAMERARYQVEADAQHPGHFQARNPAQGWTTTFSAEGALLRPAVGDWQWGFKPTAWGYGEHRQSLTEQIPTLSAEGNRLHYDWNPQLRESYRNDRDGVEQYFTLNERPADAEGALRVELTVIGGLKAELDDARNARFVDAQGYTPYAPT